MKKLIIFDCDGVLVDSEIIVSRVDAEFLTEQGYKISAEENIKKFTGKNIKTINDIIYKESGFHITESLEKLRTKRIYDALERELQPIMTLILENDIFSKLKKCVASSSSKERVIKSLNITKQKAFFNDEHIFTSEQVRNGKPAPDLFLFAADQMGYHPKDCLVIEDSIAGIQAAKAANMQVIGFLGASHTKFDWYSQRIIEQNITIAKNLNELFPIIKSFNSEV